MCILLQNVFTECVVFRPLRTDNPMYDDPNHDGGKNARSPNTLVCTSANRKHKLCTKMRVYAVFFMLLLLLVLLLPGILGGRPLASTFPPELNGMPNRFCVKCLERLSHKQTAHSCNRTAPQPPLAFYHLARVMITIAYTRTRASRVGGYGSQHKLETWVCCINAKVECVASAYVKSPLRLRLAQWLKKLHAPSSSCLCRQRVLLVVWWCRLRSGRACRRHRRSSYYCFK